MNCLKRSETLERDIRELIPEMNIRRRMSRVVKMGVCCGLESLLSFEEYGQVDAIVTATSLGAIADSEKFLSNIITSQERMLNPTPFIQSTFNTIGAQIALIRKMKCYNNTFVHRNNSFESALLESILRLECGSSSSVLVGIFDEVTPTVELLSRRLRLLGGRAMGEGAIFFVLTPIRYDSSVAQIELLLDGSQIEEGERLSTLSRSYWSGALALCLAETIEQKRECILINDMNTTMQTALKIEML
ncbi:MAG: beta-ketoacyl synthase chain length factor [Rikenellaceae bacterium]